MDHPLLVQAILFDMDGVLVDSHACVELVWREWGRLRRQDPARFISESHGRRTSETIRTVAPELDAAAEAALLDRMEEECTQGLVAVAGALELVRQIPDGRWGIVTSSHRAVARLRLTTVGVPVPPVLITGEQVERGKPDPAPYRMGREAMGVAETEALVFEDAPAGIASARAAHLGVIALTTTFAPEHLRNADYVLRDLTGVRVESSARGLCVWLDAVVC
jgi:sugar-phosphatase